MSNNFREISTYLYKRYYLLDQTPEHLISSHWKMMHKEAEVIVVKEEIKHLKGEGFSYVSKISTAQKWLSWMSIFCYLLILSNRLELLRLLKKGMVLAKKMGVPFTYDCFRQICTFALLFRISSQKEKIRVVNVGDGFGFLSSFIKEMLPQSKICLIDLGKTLLFQFHHCTKALPQMQHCLSVDPITEMPNAEAADADFVYCPAEYMSTLGDFKFDWAINIASMQEMNYETIHIYFDFLRQHLRDGKNLFYCCNRKEKTMPGGEISKFYSYPWHEQDIHLIDGPCPWHQFFLSWRYAKNGLRLFGFRIPLINYFDGLVCHRLTILHRVSGEKEN